ncbi:hypothetical protein WMF31_09525 [Sorangium sp. So ce1036]|uniref:hypothetical protein n=1 Tax=Sorangium sp. So ce1036 TaxID=3133328 RepID=UPI003F0997F0
MSSLRTAAGRRGSAPRVRQRHLSGSAPGWNPLAAPRRPSPRRRRHLQPRAGQILVPFDRARTSREHTLQRVERQLAVREPTLARDVGVAGGYDHQAGRQDSTCGTTLALGAGDYLHGAADLVFKVAGSSLSAEGVVRHAERDLFEGEIDVGCPMRCFDGLAICGCLVDGLKVAAPGTRLLVVPRRAWLLLSGLCAVGVALCALRRSRVACGGARG